MVEIQDKIVSLDVFREMFCCDLAACHGACCVEGDAGAPVEVDEIADLEEAAELLADELTPEARQVIEEEGVVEIDPDGQFVTTVVNDRDCIFAVPGGDGTTLCAIDRAYREGRTEQQKPISCALYPIRLSRMRIPASDPGKADEVLTAVNYHRWDICRPACALGQKLSLPVYQFLRAPLLRAFGQPWYDELTVVAQELKKAGYI